MNASVIIRCFNEQKHIRRLLDLLATQSMRDFEIVVVDSGSTDETLNIVQRYPVKLVHILPSEFTFGASLNRGCAEATGKFLVMISAHAFPTSGHWLTSLISGFSMDDVGIVYGAQRGGDGTKFSEHQVFKKWFPETATERMNGPFCNNANCAVRRDLWEKLHYDEEITGLEDIDFAKRAMELGYQIRYLPEASVLHLHDETTHQTLNRYRREAIAFQRIFPNEHFNFIDFLRFWLSNVGSDLELAKSEGKLAKEWMSIVKFRWAQFWGTYKGFHQRNPVDSELKRHLYYPD